MAGATGTGWKLVYAGSIIGFSISMLNAWSETQFIMMDGLIVNRKQRRFRMTLVLLVFILIFVIAIPMTGSRPMLPESYITAFFEWLQNIGRFEPPDVEVEPPEISLSQQEMDTGSYLGQALGGAQEQDETLANITRIIGWIILIALCIGAVIFLLMPLLRRDRGIAGLRIRNCATFHGW